MSKRSSPSTCWLIIGGMPKSTREASRWMRKAFAAVACVAMLLPTTARAARPREAPASPWLNPTRSPDTRAKAAAAAMTLAQTLRHFRLLRLGYDRDVEGHRHTVSPDLKSYHPSAPCSAIAPLNTLIVDGQSGMSCRGDRDRDRVRGLELGAGIAGRLHPWRLGRVQQTIAS